MITGIQKDRCVTAFYNKEMMMKVLKAWRSLPCEKNYPVKRRFN